MLVPESADIEQYLVHDEVVDWNNPGIEQAVAEATVNMVDDISKARALFEWVRDRIPHSRDVGREEITCTASEVLGLGTGLCYAKAHLLAAMLRSVGIPTGFCYQVYYEPMHVSEKRLALHGLNGVYVQGRWIRVDPRGNKDGIDAEFSLASEQLAFPDMEFLDNRVYARPLKNVMAALRSYANWTDLWPNLPTPPDADWTPGGQR